MTAATAWAWLSCHGRTRTSILALASYGANSLHTSTLPLPPLPPGLVVGLQTAGFRGDTVVLGAPSVVVMR